VEKEDNTRTERSERENLEIKKIINKKAIKRKKKKRKRLKEIKKKKKLLSQPNVKAEEEEGVRVKNDHDLIILNMILIWIIYIIII
jgi:hypothetical protein